MRAQLARGAGARSAGAPASAKGEFHVRCVHHLRLNMPASRRSRRPTRQLRAARTRPRQPRMRRVRRPQTRPLPRPVHLRRLPLGLHAFNCITGDPLPLSSSFPFATTRTGRPRQDHVLPRPRRCWRDGAREARRRLRAMRAPGHPAPPRAGQVRGREVAGQVAPARASTTAAGTSARTARALASASITPQEQVQGLRGRLHLPAHPIEEQVQGLRSASMMSQHLRAQPREEQVQGPPPSAPTAERPPREVQVWR